MNRIKECRLKKGMSQKFVALSLGVSPPSVWGWENDKNAPTQENLSALADLFGVSVDYLLGRESSTITVQGAKGNQQPQDLATFQIPTDAPKIKPLHDLPKEEYIVISDDFEPTRGPATRAIINTIIAKLAKLNDEDRAIAESHIDFLLERRLKEEQT